VASFESISLLLHSLRPDFLSLNTVIHPADVMIAEEVLNGTNFQSAKDTTLNTNLIGPLWLTEELRATLRG
jgi:short-subunit dehydrogenase involved in D-alanine esterification of teichoic acids